MLKKQNQNIFYIDAVSKYFVDNKNELLHSFLSKKNIEIKHNNYSIYQYKSNFIDFSLIAYYENGNEYYQIVKGFINTKEELTLEKLIFSSNIPTSKENIDLVFSFATYDEQLFKKAITPFGDLSLMVLYRMERSFLIKNLFFEIRIFFNNIKKTKKIINSNWHIINDYCVVYSDNSYLFIIYEENNIITLVDCLIDDFHEDIINQLKVDFHSSIEIISKSTNNFIQLDYNCSIQNILIQGYDNNINNAIQNIFDDTKDTKQFNLGAKNHSNKVPFSIPNSFKLNVFFLLISNINKLFFEEYKETISGLNLSLFEFKSLLKGRNISEFFIHNPLLKWHNDSLYSSLLIKPSFYNIKSIKKDYSVTDLFDIFNNPNSLLLTYNEKDFTKFKPIILDAINYLSNKKEFYLNSNLTEIEKKDGINYYNNVLSHFSKLND